VNPVLDRAFSEIMPVIDAALDKYLPPVTAPPGRLAEAMRYSVFAGGKRFRPVLAVLVSDSLGGPRENVIPPACALEMIHTYSLIHDDLPAMDDDDLRRGKPSSHKAFGEAMAILAGDALLTLAFEVAAGAPAAASPAKLVIEIARGAGPDGMVAGQVADVDAEGKAGGMKEVSYIHMRKTAALIRTAARVGAIAAGASEAKIDAAGRFGEALGMVFQITDDVLDVTAETARLGKTAGKDAEAGKLTFPAVLGLEGARREAAAWSGRASKSLEEFTPNLTILGELNAYVLERTS
jgi:geranylgeranyl diphosphate synthase, type II